MTRGGVDGVFGWLGANRTREMLVEDFVGFGLLRTCMDLLRGYFFGTGELDLPAARERLVSEASSIFTDNVLAGIAAFGLGWLLDRKYRGYSNAFTDFATLELFRDAARAGGGEKAFLGELAARVAPRQKQAALEALERAWNNPAIKAEERATLAGRVAKRLGQNSFDVKVGGNVLKLDNLLDDVRLFRKQMDKLAEQGVAREAGAWQQAAAKTLGATTRIKNLKLACLGLGMAATFAVPFINRWMTRKIDGIDYYPGEIGLYRAQQTQKQAASPELFARSRVYQGLWSSRQQESGRKSLPEKYFPYLTRSWREGNRWPLLLSLMPLPFAAGLFDTVNWRFLNPLKKSFGKTWRTLFDFGKRAPFTTQQQMAATFALLITSRLAGSRTENEFRERLVDSFLGWGLWILGTPLIKRAVSGYLDKKTGSQLLKNVDGRLQPRTRGEIEQLLSGAVREKTLRKNIWIGAVATVASMILLGIVEPFIAIQWTKRNAQKRQQEAAARQSAGSLNLQFQPPSSWPARQNIPLQRATPFALQPENSLAA